MPLYRHDIRFDRLDAEAIAAWAGIPPAIASDCMNRTGYPGLYSGAQQRG